MSTSTLVMSKPVSKLGGDLQKATYAFLEKLTTDDSAPGVHIEPINNCIDGRVRTGRVNQQYRAVLFKLEGSGNPIYVFVGVWNHDDAIAKAKKSTLSLNPVNGITEIRMVEELKAAPAPPPPTPAPTSAAPDSQQPLLPYSAETLAAELGLDRDLASQAAAASTEDRLLDLAARAYEWQGIALLDLASGVALAEVKARLGIEPGRVPAVSLTEDDRLAQGLRHPAAQITFAYIEDDEELRRVIEGGSVDAWRVFLHPEQRVYVDRDTGGPYRLSGGAGTGKTVVLLHRARRLAVTEPSARVLLTTFTTNLAHELGRSLARLDPSVVCSTGRIDRGVSVTGIDAMASAVLRAAGDLGPDYETVLGARRATGSGRTDTGAAWRAAIDQAGEGLPQPLRSAAFFEAEYGMVVLPHRLTDRDAYLRVRRPGRGVRLTRAQRTAVWSVVESYRLATRAAGTTDFAETAAVAAAHLDRAAASGAGRWFDHVLVDEGQDLSPAQWQLIRALVEEGPNDIFIAEDSHQRIYGHRLVLAHYGLRITGRSRRLTLNYRTTEQNLAYALKVLDGAAYADAEDAPEQGSGYRSACTGPQPRTLACASVTDELDRAAALVASWAAEADRSGTPRGTIAVLVRDRVQRDRVVSGLAERGVTVRGVERDGSAGNEPVVMTMHRAKGTEFYRVLLFGVSTSAIPRSLSSFDYSDEEKEDALLRERSLLYVAATRARDELVVSWSREPSPLLPQ